MIDTEFVRAGDGDCAAIGLRAEDCMELDAHLALVFVLTIAGDGFAIHDESVGTFDRYLRVLLAGEGGAERKASRLIASQADYQELVGERREYFASEGGAARLIADADDREFQIELAPVIGKLFLRGELDSQVA